MSSKRHLRRRQCTSKKFHRTEDTALYHARNLNRSLAAKKWHSYKCAWCKGWHVGRRNKKQIDVVKASIAYKRKHG